jgi:hypothetical protein
MTQVAVIDIIGPVAQFCPNCPTTTLVQAYIDAARKFCNASRWLKTTIPGSTTAPITTPYTTGTVTVTNASLAVVGVGTSWLANVASGDLFTGPNSIAYTVDAVTDNTHLALTAVYGGPTLATQAYSIARNREFASYGLGNDTYTEIIGIEAISIVASTIDTHPLTPGVSSEWDKTDARGVPDRYQYIAEAQFAVHPVPDASYALNVSVILQPKRGVNSLDQNLVTIWDYALQDGALDYLLRLPQAWKDVGEADRRHTLFTGHKFSAASDAQAGYNAGALPNGTKGPRQPMIRTKQQRI